MIDLLSVTISGSLNVSRARLLWCDGTAKVFGLNGFICEFEAEQPTRIKGYLARWHMQTANGPIEIRQKCIGCGGSKWWRMLRINKDELWSSA